MYPLTTTARIAALPRSERLVARLLGSAEPSDEPITYAAIVDRLDLNDALWCCQAEPALAPVLRRFTVWCARQRLLTDPRAQDALQDAHDAHAARIIARPPDATVAVAVAVAATVAVAAAKQAADVATGAEWDAAAASARDEWNDAWNAARQQQAAAFRQLVTTGSLP